MKHLLLSMCFFSLAWTALAQNCTPDVSITEPGIYADGLDTAIVNEPYNATIHVLALSDTNVIFSGSQITAIIDSVRLDTVLGLPTGFTYACEPPRCTFTSDAVGCIKLSGDPVLEDRGVYPLNIKTTAFARWGSLRLPVRDSIQDYSLVVADANGSVSIKTIDVPQIRVYPNPNNSGIYTLSSTTHVEEYEVYSSTGQQIAAVSSINLKTLDVDLSSCLPGIYIVVIKADSQHFSMRLTKR